MNTRNANRTAGQHVDTAISTPGERRVCLASYPREIEPFHRPDANFRRQIQNAVAA